MARPFTTTDVTVHSPLPITLVFWSISLSLSLSLSLCVCVCVCTARERELQYQPWHNIPGIHRAGTLGRDLVEFAHERGATG